MHEVITMAGGYNIASDLPGPYPEVDPEWVLKENPEVIFFPALDTAAATFLTGYFMDSYEDAEQFTEEACNRPGLDNTDAVNKGRVYVIEGLCVEAVRGFVGAENILTIKLENSVDPKHIEDIKDFPEVEDVIWHNRSLKVSFLY